MKVTSPWSLVRFATNACGAICSFSLSRIIRNLPISSGKNDPQSGNFLPDTYYIKLIIGFSLSGPLAQSDTISSDLPCVSTLQL